NLCDACVVIEIFCFFFQAEDGIRDFHVTGVQTCALPISAPVDLDWWKKDTSAPLITSGINADGTVALTLHRKFIEFKVTDDTLLPEVIYELLITEWASLTGQTVAEVDPDF